MPLTLEAPRVAGPLSLVDSINELLRATLVDRDATGSLSRDDALEVRDLLEERFSSGDEDARVLEALARAAILCEDLDRAKTMLELILGRDSTHVFAARLLPQINAALGLAREHSTFSLGVTANASKSEEELAARESELSATPRNLEVASTNVCNINPPCVQCWKHVDPAHGYMKRDAFHMPKELIRRLSPWIGRADQVSLHGIGEPLAHPQLFDSVRHAGPETEVVFVSNALLLSDTRIDKILDHGVGTIDFSLDAATPETFRKIRHNDFEAAVDGIRRLRDARNARGLSRPRICLNMCLMRENVHEVPLFVELAHELGAASAHLFHMNKGASYRYDWFDYEEQHCENDPVAHDAAIEEGFARAEELGVNLSMSGRRSLQFEGSAPTNFYNEEIDAGRFFCSKPWTSMLVQNSGDVYNCCWQDRPLGNLHQTSLWSIWNGATMQAIRESTAAGQPHPHCVNSSGNLCPYLGRV